MPKSLYWNVVVLAAAALAIALAGAAAAAPSERFVDTAPGVRIRLIEDGKVSREPTVVFIPGWLAHAEIWAPAMQALGGDRRVVAIDPRSQGKSTVTTTGNTPEARAEDIAAVLTDLGPEPVVLVGWSQGVQDVAAYVAAHGADGLAGVVLVDSAVSGGSGDIVRSPEVAATILRRLGVYTASPRDYVEGQNRAVFTRASDAEIAGLVERGLKTPPSVGAAILVADLYSVDRSKAFDAFDKPFLIIAAGGSYEVQAMRDLAAKVNGGRIEVIEDTGHAVFFDQAERFNAVLRAWVEGIAPPS